MRTRRLAILLTVILGGCQSTAPPPADPTVAWKVVVHPGDAVVSAVGSPFLLVFKTAVCAASVAVAGPLAALAALSDSHSAAEARRSLGEGVGMNCGPPYVLSPYRVVLAEPELYPAPPPGAAPAGRERAPSMPPEAPTPLIPE